jgi:alkanesulfonate monooxygenase SsuD/methylene tetrahydromethanopterin reductase-like flavin-dependent oxidoreductase (luciferase family)
MRPNRLPVAERTVQHGRMPNQTSPRQIRFNAFDMNCVAHQSSGMWRHPDDQAWRYKDLDYWTELAKLLERGTFDGVFIADVLGTYDVYGGSNEAAIRHGAQVPVNDPVLLVSAMAHVTEHLGFGITAGTSTPQDVIEQVHTVVRSLAGQT